MEYPLEVGRRQDGDMSKSLQIEEASLATRLRQGAPRYTRGGAAFVLRLRRAAMAEATTPELPDEVGS